MIPSLETLYAHCDEVGDCLLWRGPKNNHTPQFYVAGRGDAKKLYFSCRRLVFEAVSGTTVAPNRHPVPMCRERLCIRFEHLKLLTTKQIGQLASKEGSFSTLQRGLAISAGVRKSKRAKLTIELAREIRASTETGKALAERMGVDKSLPPRIRRNEAWLELAPNASVFNRRA